MKRPNLRDTFEARLLEHERVSREQGEQVRADIAESRKESGERHQSVLGILALHTSKLDLHEHRIGTVEKKIEQGESERREVRTDWRRLVLGILSHLITTGLGVAVGHFLLR